MKVFYMEFFNKQNFYYCNNDMSTYKRGKLGDLKGRSSCVDVRNSAQTDNCGNYQNMLIDYSKIFQKAQTNSL